MPVRRALVLCALALCVTGFTLWHFAPSAAAATINVPTDYATIQGAIDAASNGDTVLVAPGTYSENINFRGKAIVLASTAGPGATTIDGRLAPRPVVTFASGEDSRSVVTGFTLKNGYADFDARYTGGGVYVDGSSPIIRGNVITENSAGSTGGGVGVRQGSPEIVNNLIQRNTTAFSGSRGGGISVYSTEGDTPSILGNQIVDNVGNSSGGGIYVNRAVYPLIQDNLISGNRAERGAGIDYSGGGSIVQNLILFNRSVFEGAAIDFLGTGPVLNNTIYGNSSLNTTSGSDVHLGTFVGAPRQDLREQRDRRYGELHEHLLAAAHAPG